MPPGGLPSYHHIIAVGDGIASEGEAMRKLVSDDKKNKIEGSVMSPRKRENLTRHIYQSDLR